LSKLQIDAATFYKIKLNDEILNGQVVGVISGNLRRSQTLRRLTKFHTLLFSDASIASYAKDVAARVKKRDGQNYLEACTALYGERIEKILTDTIESYTDRINRGVIINYQNPFPA
jgi:hypothetical protein